MLIRLLNDHLWLAVYTDRGTDTRTRGAERPEVLVGINNSHHSVPLLAAGKGPGVHKVHGPDVLVAAVHNGLTGHRQRSMLYYVCGTYTISYNSEEFRIILKSYNFVQNSYNCVRSGFLFLMDFEQSVQYFSEIINTRHTQNSSLNIFLYLLTADILPLAEKTSTLMRTFFRLRAFLPYNWIV